MTAALVIARPLWKLGFHDGSCLHQPLNPPVHLTFINIISIQNGPQASAHLVHSKNQPHLPGLPHQHLFSQNNIIISLNTVCTDFPHTPLPIDCWGSFNRWIRGSVSVLWILLPRSHLLLLGFAAVLAKFCVHPRVLAATSRIHTIEFGYIYGKSQILCKNCFELFDKGKLPPSKWMNFRRLPKRPFQGCLWTPHPTQRSIHSIQSTCSTTVLHPFLTCYFTFF